MDRRQWGGDQHPDGAGARNTDGVTLGCRLLRPYLRSQGRHNKALRV